MPSRTRRRAQTLRWPSPVQGGGPQIPPDGGEQGLVGDRRLWVRAVRVEPPSRRSPVPAPGRRRSWSAARPRPGRRAGCRGAGRWRGKSPWPSARPPPGQRAGSLDAGTEQLDLHAELADAPHGRGEFGAGGLRLALLERAVEGSIGLLASLLELEDGNAEFAGEQFHAFPTQQTQDDLPLVPGAPALTWRQRANPRRRPGGRRRWGGRRLARGQRGRAAPTRAAHRPING